MLALQGPLVGLFWFCPSADWPTVTGWEWAADPPAPTAASSGSGHSETPAWLSSFTFTGSVTWQHSPETEAQTCPVASPHPSLKGELRQEVAGGKETKLSLTPQWGVIWGKGMESIGGNNVCKPNTQRHPEGKGGMC